MTINDFRQVMSSKTDSDLLKIITVEREQFQADAIIAAEEELKRRNLTADQMDTVKTETKMNAIIDNEKSNEPLGLFLKILTFMFPVILAMFFSAAYKNSGYGRKANELTRWTIYGLIFYFGLILLGKIIDS
jgi:hypothetical protein